MVRRKGPIMIRRMISGLEGEMGYLLVGVKMKVLERKQNCRILLGGSMRGIVWYGMVCNVISVS